MGDKNEYLKEILPTTGLLFQQEFQSFVLSKPKLIPLKSVTLQKLESMQQEAEKKAKEQMSRISESDVN
ncbi:BBSome-interacting protein 1 like protein [Argiope bruennichi]|uniref:BBSome-interacting protein 1 like protein n=1 Tax=Argiope bruennichi TaxID=94029 RepID=A0A8T0FIT7_ARGBR|nr:BBSome-interacting protein 1 like protein [Argiope bruennichi]